MLMAIVIGAAVVVAWLALVYWTNQSYAARVAAPIEIIEVYSGGGGTPEGEPDSSEQIDVSDADMAAFASNAELEAADFEEPSVMENPSAMLDALNEVAQQFADMPEEMRTGNQVATGQRSSKLGTGGPAYGFGAGDGGVPREQRWSIVYNPGDTPDEYARQLDFLGVEMATVINNQMEYVSQFSSPNPRRRTSSGRGDDRLYFLWQGAGRKASDITLMKKGGIDVGREGAIFQFYPKGVEDQLAQLEVRYKGRQPAEIRMSRFTVVPQGRGYAFQVIDQQPLN